MGHVYVLRNPAIPGLLKIGMTKRAKLDSRVQELSMSTGVPMPFQVVYSVKTKKPRELECAVHQRLTRWRVNSRREFFSCPLWMAKRAIRKEAGLFDWFTFTILVIHAAAFAAWAYQYRGN